MKEVDPTVAVGETKTKGFPGSELRTTRCSDSCGLGGESGLGERKPSVGSEGGGPGFEGFGCSGDVSGGENETGIVPGSMANAEDWEKKKRNAVTVAVTFLNSE